MAFQIGRLVGVLALLGIAAALATPKDRLPLALRGLARMTGRSASGCRGVAPSAGRRLLSVLLIVAAIILVLI